MRKRLHVYDKLEAYVSSNLVVPYFVEQVEYNSLNYVSLHNLYSSEQGRPRRLGILKSVSKTAKCAKLTYFYRTIEMRSTFMVVYVQ